ncbi:MAG: pseudouridylate synthase [Flavobacteriales bacterium]|nr:pseudouridylate synthase [Flavobacteriales bacterium]
MKLITNEKDAHNILMDNQFVFNFSTDIVNIEFPKKLNNPFALDPPELAKIASGEFQDFIASESKNWNHDFDTQKGKMFGVLVFQQPDNSLGYLGTVSGKLQDRTTCNQFVPSVFDDSTDDYYINKGMTELTEIGKQIIKAENYSEINSLTEHRKLKSFALQKWLFENYTFSNITGEEKNILQIFKDSHYGNPPSAAGECAAPKLLHYAFKHQLKPIAMAEFWWGNPKKNKEREHKFFYPACENKCRPILEYMLNDKDLFDQVNIDN